MEKDCNNCKFELYNADEIPCKDCGMEEREYWQPKPQTNADRIRAMSDETLATQFVQVIKETIKVLTDLDVPDELSNEIRSNLLEKLKQPADMRGEEE